MRIRRLLRKHASFLKHAGLSTALVAVLFLCALYLAAVHVSPRLTIASVLGCWLGSCSTDVGNYHPACDISVSPSSISPGDSATLSWTSNIISPYITPNLVTVNATGNLSVIPGKTTTYTLYDYAGGYDFLRYWLYVLLDIPSPAPYCSTTVSVSGSPAPPTCLFGASPTTIVQGSATTLYYSIQGNVSSASIQNLEAVQVNPPLTYAVSPTATTTYKLNVSGPGGNNKCFTTVNVAPAPSVPTIFFDVYPPRVSKQKPILLSWSGWNVASCILFDSAGNTISTALQNPIPAPTFVISKPTIFTFVCITSTGITLQKKLTVTLYPSMQEI